MARTTRAGGYAETSQALLAQAKAELAKGDRLQASEKLWGAAAQMVRAVAARRRWRHDSHGSLFDALDRLVEETGDQDLRIGFHVANSLHVNFYENWQSQGYVESSVATIERFVSQLERL